MFKYLSLLLLTLFSFMIVGTTHAVVDDGGGTGTGTGRSAPRSGITNPILQGDIGSDQAAAESGSLLAQIISGLLSFVMVLASLLVLISLIQAAVDWIGSGGDTGKVQKARDRILNAVIGIIILAASIAVWQIVNQFFGLELRLPLIFAPAS